MRQIDLNIGDIVVTREPAILGTILGSCVSVCLMDIYYGIAGMNHFILPHNPNRLSAKVGCYGAESVPKLIETVIEAGGDFGNLKAKLFGGGKVIKSFSADLDVGRKNVEIARQILASYNIPIIREYTRAGYGIRVVFHTETGKAYVKQISNDMAGDMTADSNEAAVVSVMGGQDGTR